eukprot:506751_1
MSQTSASLIRDLWNRHQIKIASEQFHDHIEQLRYKKSRLICRVISNKVVKANKFNFSFYLLFGPHLPYHKGLQIDSYNTKEKEIYYYYSFTVNYYQLEIIHFTLLEHQQQNKYYFATKPYPATPDQTVNRRPQWLNNQINDENQYLSSPILPSGITKNHTTADVQDLTQHTQFLDKVLNSQVLCVEEFVFDVLAFDLALKLLIQQTARKPLKLLRTIPNKYPLIDDMNILRNKTSFEYHYHTLYVTEIEGSSLSYALKFEGNYNLLTIYCDHIGRNMKLRMLVNTPLNRRVFWYGIYMIRCNVMDHIWLNCISAANIGQIIANKTTDYFEKNKLINAIKTCAKNRKNSKLNNYKRRQTRFEKINHNIGTMYLVCGYIHTAQSDLFDHTKNSFYTIPDLIICTCAMYYYACEGCD